MEKLLKLKCRACEGLEDRFDEAKTTQYLKMVKDWKLVDGPKIEKGFKFKDFKESLEFVNKIAKLAEEEGHHPDILMHNWNRVKIMLSTHAVKGLSINDFILATKIDAL